MKENLKNENIEDVEVEEKKEVKQNMLRARADKLEEITDEKWALVNEVNREMYEEYFEYNSQLSPKTLKQYRTCLKQFFWFVYEKLKDKPFYEVSKKNFMKYLNFMHGRGLSSSAIGLRKSSVSSFCNYVETYAAEDMEECNGFRNFTRGMPSLTATQCYEKIPVSKEEYELIIKTLEERKDYLGLAWVVTAYNVGARRSELIQFKTEILDYEMKEGATYVDSHFVRGKGKSTEGKPIKYIINLESLKYMKLWVEKRGYKSDFIFTSKYGGTINAISANWANEFCSNILSPIVGRRINPHIMRGSAATRLLEQGLDIKIVSKYVMHHNSIETTQIYDLRDFEEEKNNIFKL